MVLDHSFMHNGARQYVVSHFAVLGDKLHILALQNKLFLALKC